MTTVTIHARKYTEMLGIDKKEIKEIAGLTETPAIEIKENKYKTDKPASYTKKVEKENKGKCIIL